LPVKDGVLVSRTLEACAPGICMTGGIIIVVVPTLVAEVVAVLWDALIATKMDALFEYFRLRTSGRLSSTTIASLGVRQRSLMLPGYRAAASRSVRAGGNSSSNTSQSRIGRMSVQSE